MNEIQILAKQDDLSDFSDALKALKSGKAIKRKWWVNKKIIFLNFIFVEETLGTKIEYEFTTNEILATDWVIFD